jgi:hypothetical protein
MTLSIKTLSLIVKNVTLSIMILSSAVMLSAIYAEFHI